MILVNEAPSATVWFGISLNTGASLSGVTVNVAPSELLSKLGSVAVNVINSLPFQLMSGIVIVATRSASILTESSLLPENVHVSTLSASSISLT